MRARRRRKMRRVRHAAARIKTVPPAGTTAQRCYTAAPSDGRSAPGDTDDRTHAQIPRSPRPRAHHRRGRRRPERHRDVLAGRRAVRPRHAVERVPDHAADGRHPGRQRADRPRHAATASRATCATTTRGRCCGSSCRCCSSRTRSTSAPTSARWARRCELVIGGPSQVYDVDVRRARDPDAAVHSVPIPGAGAEVADAVAVRLRRRAARRRHPVDAN